MTVTLDDDGRIFLPKETRDQLGVKPGASLTLDVYASGDGAPRLELRPETGGSRLEYVDGLLVFTGAVDPETDIVGLIREQREPRHR